jgi:hypothetical protein
LHAIIVTTREISSAIPFLLTQTAATSGTTNVVVQLSTRQECDASGEQGKCEACLAKKDHRPDRFEIPVTSAESGFAVTWHCGDGQARLQTCSRSVKRPKTVGRRNLQCVNLYFVRNSDFAAWFWPD